VNIRIRLALAAGVLMLATVVAGASTAAPTRSCEARQLSQPFLPWLDPGQYFLYPGGDFETAGAWTTTGGARIVPGNEPFRVNLASDSRSLYLPSSAAARGPAICVASDEPLLRFFVKSAGSPLSVLTVEARVRTTVLGITTSTTVPLGIVLGAAAQTWQPSLPVVFELSLDQLLAGSSTVEVRFTPIGLGGQWYVDDVYVDPIKDRAAL
jgi:hypothetical protein